MALKQKETFRHPSESTSAYHVVTFTMRLFFAALFVVSIGSLAAQTRPVASSGGFLESFSTEYSYSSRESLNHAGPAGEVAVNHFGFTLAGRRPLSATDTLLYGLSAQLDTLDATPGTPLPDQLSAVAFSIGVSRQLSREWTASLTLRPGLYGDFAEIDSKTFNVPLLLGATYARSADLVWLFGLRADLYAEHPVLPFVGVRWKFAPEWSLNLAFPRSGVQWRVSERLSLDAGVSLQGGTYRITENLGTPAGVRGRLANTFVDYSEIRAGLGAEIALNPTTTLRLDAGAFIDREFEFFDRNYTLDGDGGLFAAISLRSRF